jgi:hypothetical protein
MKHDSKAGNNEYRAVTEAMGRIGSMSFRCEQSTWPKRLCMGTAECVASIFGRNVPVVAKSSITSRLDYFKWLGRMFKTGRKFGASNRSVENNIERYHRR